MSDQAAAARLTFPGPAKEAFLLLIASAQGPRVCDKPAVTFTREAALVRAAEKECGADLSVALLLFLEQPGLDEFDFDLASLVRLQAEASDAHLPGGLVALGHSSGRHGAGRRRSAEGGTWICMARGGDPEELVTASEGNDELGRFTVAEWLIDIAEERLNRFEYREPPAGRDSPLLNREDRSVIEAWTKKAGLVVELSGTPAKEARPTRRVKHAKFGEGVVLSEDATSDDVKLEIDFGAAGVKKLLGKFVADA